MAYRSRDGREIPVRSAEDWAVRPQAESLRAWRPQWASCRIGRNCPRRSSESRGRSRATVFHRLEIAYRVDEDEWVPAHLYLPKNRPVGQRVAAVVAMHGTTQLGKKQLSGEPGSPPNRCYAVELAQRGYVVLAPDYPSFGDYPCDFRDPKWASGTMKGIFNHIRGVDLLVAREEVDPERIGAIGHSLGGHNAMFLGVFDPRIKAVVSSCGWTPFHDYYGGKLVGWTSDRYMPRIRTEYQLDPNRNCRSISTRWRRRWPRGRFFSNSPLRDSNFDVAGGEEGRASGAGGVTLCWGLPIVSRLSIPTPGTIFRPEVRQVAYRFLDRALAQRP